MSNIELRKAADPLDDIAEKMGHRSIAALLSTYYLVLKANLAQDSYILIRDVAGLSPASSVDTLSGWFASLADSGKILPLDLKNFQSYANIHSLREFYENHSHTTPHFTRFRGKINGEFRSILMEFIPAEDYTPENPSIYMFIKDVHESISDSSTPLWKVFQSLCDDYESIYYVDFDADSIVPYRSGALSPGHFDLEPNTSRAYWPTISNYIRQYVDENEQSHLLQIFRREYLEEALRQKTFFVQILHVNAAGRSYTFQVKFSNLSDGAYLNKMVIAFANISAQDRREQSHSQKQHVLLVIEQDSVLSDILRNDFTVYSCDSYTKSLELYSQHQTEISLVVADYIPPQMDRDILLQQVCATAHEKNLPIIVTSSFALEDTLEHLKYGISDVIDKPYHREIIRNRIAHTIHLNESSAMLEHFKWDELTGLYERKSFLQYAQMRVEQAPNHKYMILSSDMENFKGANEWLGWEHCSQLLRELAHMLAQNLPGYVMGGRVTTDVFVFLLQDVTQEQLLPVFAQVANWEKQAKVIIRFGLTNLIADLSIEQNYAHARTALKANIGVYGKHFAVYDNTFRKNLVRKNQLEADAEIALQTNQFMVYYQPKQDLRTMKIGGAEALVRWNHPELGMLSPGEFIPLFERSGFITRLDEYLVRLVCQDIRRWLDMGRQVVPVSVNLSRRDFERDDLAALLRSLADQLGVPHHLLRFEITESSYTSSPENIALISQELVENGFCLELDDFGSGYSSLVALGALDLNCLKIDKSLVDQLETEAGRKILLSAIGLAQSLGLKTIAEGVETAAQQLSLQKMNCDYIQGFFYARPMSSENFEAFLI